VDVARASDIAPTADKTAEMAKLPVAEKHMIPSHLDGGDICEMSASVGASPPRGSGA
jgi:hypothetical protein